jgi:precorrin isomerase
MNINWHMTGEEIEAESFRRLEAEVGAHGFPPEEWRVVRRLIHASADLGLAGQVRFLNDPIRAGLAALSARAPIYCDSNMIHAGLSLARLQRMNPAYARSDLHCGVADPAVAEAARARGQARSLVALERALDVINGGIVLIGNAPLALAGLARLIGEGRAAPALVVAMPVGFVHVEESKAMIQATAAPQIVIEGRRGGSALAVAALHAIIENGTAAGVPA